MDLVVLLVAYFIITAFIMLFAYSFTQFCLWLVSSERIQEHSGSILVILVLIICTAMLLFVSA